MAESIKSNLYPCAHCKETGTCTNGKDGASCTACIIKNEIFMLFRFKTHVGLLCGACGGIGQAEPLTERMNKRTKPMLAIAIVLIMFTLIFFSLLTKSPHFTAILAFATTLIGTIAGYYFSSNKTGNV